MEKDLQRIKIAEVCGWTRYGQPEQMIGRPKGYSFNDGPCLNLPDYLNDLNAMHEAEKILMGKVGYDWPKHGEFCRKLYDICVKAGTPPYSATAAQRAEAFLKALKLWK